MESQITENLYISIVGRKRHLLPQRMVGVSNSNENEGNLTSTASNSLLRTKEDAAKSRICDYNNKFAKTNQKPWELSEF